MATKKEIIGQILAINPSASIRFNDGKNTLLMKLENAKREERVNAHNAGLERLVNASAALQYADKTGEIEEYSNSLAWCAANNAPKLGNLIRHVRWVKAYLQIYETTKANLGEVTNEQGDIVSQADVDRAYTALSKEINGIEEPRYMTPMIGVTKRYLKEQGYELKKIGSDGADAEQSAADQRSADGQPQIGETQGKIR